MNLPLASRQSNLVVDASVIVKWTLPDPTEEPHTERALALLEEIKGGRVAPLQPCHWLAETAAVITRLRPDTAEEVIELLDAMEFSILEDVAIYKRASRIAAALQTCWCGGRRRAGHCDKGSSAPYAFERWLGCGPYRHTD